MLRRFITNYLSGQYPIFCGGGRDYLYLDFRQAIVI